MLFLDGVLDPLTHRRAAFRIQKDSCLRSSFVLRKAIRSEFAKVEHDNECACACVCACCMPCTAAKLIPIQIRSPKPDELVH